MKRIDELFDVKYGVNLELNALTLCNKADKNAINFVSRSSGNNGVSAVVERLTDIEPIPAGTISVAAGGSVLETYLQPEPYYSGRDLYFLTAKQYMTDVIKLFYCTCIRANKYRYNYGRQANKTLKDILIPDLSEIPDWAINAIVPSYSDITEPYQTEKPLIWNKGNKADFTIDELFCVEYPKTLIYSNMRPDVNGVCFVSSKAKNNGVVGRVERQWDIKTYPAGCITVPLKGSVLCSSVQMEECYVAHQIAVLTSKDNISIYSKMYLVTLINANKFRFNYGRQADNTLRSLSLQLPVNEKGKPDYLYMEQYIKSLPYSAGIQLV